MELGADEEGNCWICTVSCRLVETKALNCFLVVVSAYALFPYGFCHALDEALVLEWTSNE